MGEGELLSKIDVMIVDAALSGPLLSVFSAQISDVERAYPLRVTSPAGLGVQTATTRAGAGSLSENNIIQLRPRVFFQDSYDKINTDIPGSITNRS